MAKSKPNKPVIPTNIEIEQWPVDKPIDYPKNARLITEKAVVVVGNSLKAYGFNQPIIVDVNGVIIAGHTRRRAAKSIGLANVPVMVARHLTKEQVDAYRLMDNRSAQETTWDVDVLTEVLADMAKTSDASLISEMTGFDSREVEAYIGDLATVPSLDVADEPKGRKQREKKPKGEKCSCPKCGYTWTKAEDAEEDEPEELDPEEVEEEDAPVKPAKKTKAVVEEEDDEEPVTKVTRKAPKGPIPDEADEDTAQAKKSPKRRFSAFGSIPDDEED
jgi:hypothetical protein